MNKAPSLQRWQVKTPWWQILLNHGACDPAIEYAKTKRSMRTAWRDCENGSWMAWWLVKIGVHKSIRVPALVECAALIAHHTTDPRVAKCREVTLAWARNEASDAELHAARAEAAGAAWAAWAAEAMGAAWAAWAAWAVGAVEAVEAVHHKRCADIIRKHIPDIEAVMVKGGGK